MTLLLAASLATALLGPPPARVGEAREADPTASPAPPPRSRATIGTKKTGVHPKGIRGTKVSGTALLSSGLSVSPGPTHAITNRSPAQLSVDFGFRHPEVPWLELAPGMMLEMERGVGFGVALRMRAFLPLRRVMPYVLIGAPAFLVPSTLYGAQFGAGAAIVLHRTFAIAVEFGPSIFFWGDDLSVGILAKFDGSAGLRVSF